jgi:hypothetical protein
MDRIALGAAIIAAGFIAAQPCAAASGYSERSSSAFAGLNIRMPLGEARARPVARLQFTAGYNLRDVRSGSTETFRAKGLEIGAARNGKPNFYLNGHSTADMQRRFGANGSTGSTLLIVGGVLLAVVVIAVAAGGAGMGDTCPVIDGSRDHCINP